MSERMTDRMADRDAEPATSKHRWIPAWLASPQPVWADEYPLTTDLPDDLHDVTIRQIVRVAYPGTRIRIVMSNRYGTKAVRLDAVHVAPSVGGAQIDAALDRTVTFGGQASAVLPPGANLSSDPIALAVTDSDEIAVSIRLVEAPHIGSFHWDGRRTGYVLPGDQLSVAAPAAAATTERRLFLAGVLVEAADSRGVVVAFGDSITDGASATVDREVRWTDFLVGRAAPRGISVVNGGISGARLLSDGMGTNALARIERDVIGLADVRALILLIGINDIAWPGTPFSPTEPPMTFDRMVVGYRVLAAHAHAANIRVIGGTLPPFADALPDTPMAATYYSPEKNALRCRINAWIRDGETFDATIDFDRLLEDPHRPGHLLKHYDGGDHLHPGDEGNRAMADAIDLDALLGR
jgi:lysophospholipase L1-like esterase